MKRFFAPLALLALLAGSRAAHAQTTVFHDDFESGFSNWSMTGQWNPQDASEPCSVPVLPFPSGTHCVWFGRYANGLCDYDAPTFDLLGRQYLTTTQPIQLPVTDGTIDLSFVVLADTEVSADWDMHGVEISEVGTTTWTDLGLSFGPAIWRVDRRDLTAWASKSVLVRFSMYPVDGWNNQTLGLLIDDVRITEFPGETHTYTTCAGDGSWVVGCPCGSTSPAGRGCRNGSSITGAKLSTTGLLRASADTFRVHADGLPIGPALLCQSSAKSYLNVTTFGGDGVTCISGTNRRIASRFAPGGVFDYPVAGDVPISVLGLVQPGQSLHYWVRYRDSSSFCSSAAFNVTNTVTAFWRP